ncbi:MAG: IGHMBP2 family helicase [Bacteroidetes bacterium]|nr:IGHMBP2 family helicase [Bacteroidota bacterium]
MATTAENILRNLLDCLDLEDAEQRVRYASEPGYLLKGLRITRRGMGYLDYPEVSFRLPFPADASLFRDSMPVECFCAGEAPVKGQLVEFDGRQGLLRLFTPDFPEWLEEGGLQLRAMPDTRTTGLLKAALQRIPADRRLARLFDRIHGLEALQAAVADSLPTAHTFLNPTLNASQQMAVHAICSDQELVVIHGPPGTGKTTTLIEGIRQLAAAGQKLIVTAPSNAAVDHLARGLLERGLRLLRVGNTGRIDPAVFPHTPEGRQAGGREQKELKDLRIRAEQFRRMAMKYKRSFGKAEREQRDLLFKEVRTIREEIRRLQDYQEERLFQEAQVVAGTPVGLLDARADRYVFDTLVIDEAGQCTSPFAWCALPLAGRAILAGDPLQLPPTVLSKKAAALGLARSILESAIENGYSCTLLDTQYRMKPSIAAFSSQQFYGGKLKTSEQLQDTGVHITFIDTAGAGFEEQRGPEGNSLWNEGEAGLVLQLINAEGLLPFETVVVTPYSAQAEALGPMLPEGMRCSTIDSFQGQEMRHVVVSLVRSNIEGEIGFLKDYRRMNVALTRAKDALFVVGDSATVGADAFYAAFLSHVEAQGHYRTSWEFVKD